LLVLYCLVNIYHFLVFISAEVFRILFHPNSFDFTSFITYMIHQLLPNYTSKLLNGFTILFHL
jgi:hypothetical protein